MLANKIEPKLDHTQCGLVLAVVLQTTLSLSSKFLRNFGIMLQGSTHVLSTSRKHTTGYFGKSFGSVAGVRCWRPPVTDRQFIVFLLRRLLPCRRSWITNVHRGYWPSTRVCAGTTTLHSLHQGWQTHLLSQATLSVTAE